MVARGNMSCHMLLLRKITERNRIIRRVNEEATGMEQRTRLASNKSY